MKKRLIVLIVICSLYRLLDAQMQANNDLNLITGSSFILTPSFSVVNTPENTVQLGLQAEFDINYRWQFVNSNNTDNFYLRTYVFGWRSWNKIWHSGNLNRSDIDFSAKSVNCNDLSTNKVGIGTNSTNAKLHVFNSYDLSIYEGLKMFYEGSWGTAQYASNFRFIDISSTEGGNILQMNGYGMGIGFDPPQYLSNDKLYINGNVGIGTTTPGSYKLNVAGSIRANEIKVNTTGADFVFEPTYKLRSLAEVETFINQHKHLPDVAPAAEMQTNGVSMGEMQAKLLQKVEELTLYVIEQNKIIEKQQMQILEMNKELKKLNQK